MTTAKDQSAVQIDLRHRQLGGVDARCAVFRRSYDAELSEVWDACTDPERLSRWYAPVVGDLRVGGRFTQGNFGDGRVVACEPPRLLRVALGGAEPPTDEITLTLQAAPDGSTVLEFEHATTGDTHEIGGQVYDAVYCMGGGYPPRLLSLDQHLRGTLPADLDPSNLHLREEYRASISGGMAALQVLLDAAATDGA